ncbi:EC1118_1G1_5963p [Saccharomyces cerevisiae EC1118]|uniref:EC1118_1G1_5963p n=1 Tax=Saccharomyces cerevisiae (strain Lalvin EC1118 / Prise de mousse) TaxID=643680 RepID=C8Z9F1_YEAS8|nr:EC1118_1G1_5963p [Saccharomyces cerevisiae EC1118]
MGSKRTYVAKKTVTHVLYCVPTRWISLDRPATSALPIFDLSRLDRKYSIPIRGIKYISILRKTRFSIGWEGEGMPSSSVVVAIISRSVASSDFLSWLRLCKLASWPSSSWNVTSVGFSSDPSLVGDMKSTSSTKCLGDSIVNLLLI